jgi:hypothetical protein
MTARATNVAGNKEMKYIVALMLNIHAVLKKQSPN